MSFDSLKPFLKTGVILAFFRIEGKTPLSAHSLKKSQIKLPKIWEFSFNIPTGISVFWVAFLVSSFLISFLTSATDTFTKITKTKQRSIIQIFYCNTARMTCILQYGSENRMRNIISQGNRPMKIKDFQVNSSIR